VGGFDGVDAEESKSAGEKFEPGAAFSKEKAETEAETGTGRRRRPVGRLRGRSLQAAA
jgi:hypothetical protein